MVERNADELRDTINKAIEALDSFDIIFGHVLSNYSTRCVDEFENIRSLLRKGIEVE